MQPPHDSFKTCSLLGTRVFTVPSASPSLSFSASLVVLLPVDSTIQNRFEILVSAVNSGSNLVYSGLHAAYSGLSTIFRTSNLQRLGPLNSLASVRPPFRKASMKSFNSFRNALAPLTFSGHSGSLSQRHIQSTTTGLFLISSGTFNRFSIEIDIPYG